LQILLQEQRFNQDYKHVYKLSFVVVILEQIDVSRVQYMSVVIVTHSYM